VRKPENPDTGCATRESGGIKTVCAWITQTREYGAVLIAEYYSIWDNLRGGCVGTYYQTWTSEDALDGSGIRAAEKLGYLPEELWPDAVPVLGD